jgi:membrane-associated phospholipid phosphatase
MHQADWRNELRRRAKEDWAIKLPGISAFMALFFITYFTLLNHPAYHVTVMPLTALDRWITFRPGAVWLYISLWFYSPIAAALQGNRRDLVRHAIAAALLASVGSVIFYVWPSAVPIWDLDWSQHPILAPLKHSDASGNACPSLHVAFAVFSGVALERILRRVGSPAVLRVANAAWCFGIAYSTLAVRQHVTIDVIAGAALGAAATFILRGDEGPLVRSAKPSLYHEDGQRSRNASCASRSGT